MERTDWTQFLGLDADPPITSILERSTQPPVGESAMAASGQIVMAAYAQHLP